MRHDHKRKERKMELIPWFIVRVKRSRHQLWSFCVYERESEYQVTDSHMPVWLKNEGRAESKKLETQQTAEKIFFSRTDQSSFRNAQLQLKSRNRNYLLQQCRKFPKKNLFRGFTKKENNFKCEKFSEKNLKRF
jgi:hypothetical protein